MDTYLVPMGTSDWVLVADGLVQTNLTGPYSNNRTFRVMATVPGDVKEAFTVRIVS